MPKVALNTPAPDFELTDYNGKRVRLSDFRGRNVLLVFNRGFM
jgi:peroxiredoxin